MQKVNNPASDTDEMRPEYDFNQLREALPRGHYAARANARVTFPESDVPPAFQRALRDSDLDPTRRAAQRAVETSLRHVEMQQATGLIGPLVTPSSRLSVAPLVAEVEFTTQTSARFVFDYVEFRLMQNNASEVIWSNKYQVVPVEVTLRIIPKTGQVRIHLNQKTPAANAHEFLTMLRLQRCLSEPVAVRIVDRSTGIKVFHTDFAESLGPPPDPAFVALMEDLDMIQLKLQRPIRIVSGQPVSRSDQDVIGKLRAILHEGGFTTTWNDYTPELPVAGAKAALEAFSNGQAVSLEAAGEETETLFGEQLPLGSVQFTFKARLANEAELRERLEHVQSDAEMIKVRFVPADDPQLRVVYVDWVPQPTTSESAESDTDPPGQAPQVVPEFITVLPDAEMDRLKTAASTLGVSPEFLLRASVADLLNGLDDGVRGDIDYILKENAELYRRLA